MKNKYVLYGSEGYAVAIMRPLQDVIRQRGDEVAWFFDGPGAKNLNKSEVLLKSVDEVTAFNPTAIFAPGNVIPHFLPGLKVQVFHGFDAGKPRHLYIRGFFDIYCTTGPKDTAAFQELAKRHRHFAVYETGWPKLDPLYQGKLKSEKKSDKPTILYHSTFSPSWSAAQTLFPTLQNLMKDPKWNWLISFHPKMAPETIAKFKSLVSRNVEFCEDDNILQIQQRADVMVSDTSSALHEFLMQGKPVVTFNNRAPGPYLINIRDPAHLEGSIDQALIKPASLMAEVVRYANNTHPTTDGRASDRVLKAVDDYLAKDLKKSLRAKPLNLWRKIKVRARFGHYRIW